MPVVKRQVAGKASALADKRPKLDQMSSQIASITKALHGAEGLPPSVLAMLEKMLPVTLAVPKENRHPFQAQVVTMLEEELAGVESAIKKQIQDAEAIITNGDEQKPHLEADIAKAEESLQQVEELLSQKKCALADAAEAFKASKASLEAARSAEQIASGCSVSASKRKADLEKAMSLLTDSEAMPGEEKATQLLNLAAGLDCDASLLAALPNAFSSEASAFGDVVIQQFKEEVSKAITKAEIALKEAEPTQSEKQSALDAAEEEHKTSIEQLVASGGSYEEVDEQRTAADAALEAAKKPLHDLDLERSRAMRSISKFNAQLSKFQGGPMATFAELRERSSSGVKSLAIEAETAIQAGPEQDSPSKVDAEASEATNAASLNASMVDDAELPI